MAFRDVRGSPVRRKGFPASSSLLGATEGSFPNADLKTGELFSVTPTSSSIAWENFWEEEQLWKEKKKFFVFFNLIVVRTWRPDLLTSSERYSMAFYLRGRATCSSHPLPVVLLLFLLGWPELPPESFAEEMRDRRGEWAEEPLLNLNFLPLDGQLEIS